MLEVVHRPKYRLTGKKLPPIKSRLIKKDESGNAIYVCRKNKFLYVVTSDHRKWIIPISRKEISKLIDPWEDIVPINVKCRVCDTDLDIPTPLSTIAINAICPIYIKSEGTVVGTMNIHAVISIPLILNEKTAFDLFGYVKIHDTYIVSQDHVFYNMFYNVRKTNTKKEEE